MTFKANNNNNNSNRRNTNTRSFQLYMDVEKWESPTTVVLGYWDSMISMKMHPALESSKRSNTNVYDYEQQLSTALSPEKALMLSKAIEDVILPAGMKGEETSRAVTVSGGSTLIIVGTKKFEEAEGLQGFLNISRIGDDFKPTEAATFVFAPMSIIKDYNPTSGEYGIDFDDFSELRLFKTFLDASIEQLTFGTAHASRTVDRYFRDRVMEGLGIQSGGGGGNNRFNNRSGNRFEKGRQSQQNTMAEEQTLENADDINGVMG